jgi:Fe-S cluster assembly ATP-binding protein
VLALKKPDRALILITHFPRILETIQPDYIHVLSNGTFVKHGGKELAFELEARGYDWIQPGGGA